MSDEKSKLESLKVLRSEMKDWKKQDMKKKKKGSDPILSKDDPTMSDGPQQEKDEGDMDSAQEQSKQQGDEDNSLLVQLLKKLVK